MKPKELQTGDYVRFKRTKEIIGVFEIDGDRNVINNEPDGYCSEKNIAVDDVEPIPLTPKILELNGCIKTEYGYALYMDNGIVVFLDEDNSYRVIIVKTTVITVRYVHELQNALRLCGLNDLADNLKLEE